MKKKNEIVEKASQELSTVQITKEDIKNYFCPKATEKELVLALGVIQSLNLNPHTREVHLVKYSDKDKLQIIVGYEVYLKRAECSGKLDGWKCSISDDGKRAWVEIKRKDQSMPFYWEIEISEFDKKQASWKSMPTFMAKKVAIAQGFRLCFPQELGGMPYTQEEHQAFGINQPASTNPKANVAEPEATSEPQVANPPVNAFKEMLNRFQRARAIIGEQDYYLILSAHKIKHTNEIKKMELADKILEEMRQLHIARLKKEKEETDKIPFGEDENS